MTANLLLFAGFVLSMLLMSFNYGRKKRKVVFFGDSITEQGLKPKGYLQQIRKLIKQDDEDEKYELIGAGRNGDNVNDLLGRADEDVLAKGADIVVVFIGVNDVWSQQTNVSAFEEVYKALIEKLRVGQSKIILCTPAVIGERKDYNPLDNELDEFSESIRNLAAENGFPVVDFRRSFVDYNLVNNIDNIEAGVLTTDGVHLTDKGNQLVAEEMWKVIKEIKWL